MIRVDCTNGDERDRRPERFFMAERSLEVREILDRWFGCSYTYFKVVADDGHTYILKHHRLEDSWEVSFTETDPPPRPEPSWPYTRTTSRPS